MVTGPVDTRRLAQRCPLALRRGYEVRESRQSTATVAWPPLAVLVSPGICGKFAFLHRYRVVPHLRRDWAHPATSAPRLDSPLPQLHQDRAQAGLSVQHMGTSPRQLPDVGPNDESPRSVPRSTLQHRTTCCNTSCNILQTCCKTSSCCNMLQHVATLH